MLRGFRSLFKEAGFCSADLGLFYGNRLFVVRISDSVLRKPVFAALISVSVNGNRFLLCGFRSVLPKPVFCVTDFGLFYGNRFFCCADFGLFCTDPFFFSSYGFRTQFCRKHSLLCGFLFLFYGNRFLLFGLRSLLYRSRFFFVRIPDSVKRKAFFVLRISVCFTETGFCCADSGLCSSKPVFVVRTSVCFYGNRFFVVRISDSVLRKPVFSCTDFGLC